MKMLILQNKKLKSKIVKKKILFYLTIRPIGKFRIKNFN